MASMVFSWPLGLKALLTVTRKWLKLLSAPWAIGLLEDGQSLEETSLGVAFGTLKTHLTFILIENSFSLLIC